MKRFLSWLFIFLSPSLLISNDVKLSTPMLYLEQDQAFAIVNVTWKNSWYTSKNHDAVWIFFKFRAQRGSRHVYIASGSHEVVSYGIGSKSKLKINASEDGTGVFVQPSATYRGQISATLKLYLDKTKFGRLNLRATPLDVYAIEMVYIPKGRFYLGEPDTMALAYGSLYQSDRNGQPKDLYRIEKEDDEIQVGPQNNALYYRNPSNYEGDKKGPIPSAFPKGVNAFYIMKYEPTQGQYAAFLNTLNDGQSQHRANFAGKSYAQNRGSISIFDGQYQAKFPNAVCNFMSWDDAMAYADWSGLRPMTEFEFTKAARGPGKPIVNQFPWGGATKDKVMRRVNDHGEFIMMNEWEESKLSDRTLEHYAASYYWVMDLAGGLWERVVSIGHPMGRAFTGTHGDGKLDGRGFATNEDWPSSQMNKGGFGFRGGGFYGYGRNYHHYNPYSPISFRPYGGWDGGDRTVAYGARFVRTAE